jgi:hypothetical protein
MVPSLAMRPFQKRDRFGEPARVAVVHPEVGHFLQCLRVPLAQLGPPNPRAGGDHAPVE